MANEVSEQNNDPVLIEFRLAVCCAFTQERRGRGRLELLTCTVYYYRQFSSLSI